ncbi:unnamed protein product [Cylicostephanus goldi]|uniref:Sulfur globule protein CV3 n=1 Tax=Cylicostephanus goldi TaxID=71465 RepID=A0A3P6RR07_CYLGO|nr:unnamed protein product [Cylicostephanus goldi]
MNSLIIVLILLSMVNLAPAQFGLYIGPQPWMYGGYGGGYGGGWGFRRRWWRRPYWRRPWFARPYYYDPFCC